jgi:hypothetical protein
VSLKQQLLDNNYVVIDNFITEEYKNCINVIIDSDMFFMNDININDLMRNHNFAFIPQYRGDAQEVFYAWNGIIFVKPDQIINPKEFDFDWGTILGQRTDIGGYSHFYFEKYILNFFKYRIITLNSVVSGWWLGIVVICGQFKIS